MPNVDTNIYTTRQLLGVFRDEPPVQSYWLDLAFNRQVNFASEYIEFEKLTRERKLAPLVVPMAQGKPMYTAASKVSQVKPAYIKAKDAVSPDRILRKLPGTLSAPDTSLQQRHDAVVADIQLEHNQGIQRRWEWMAAKAVQDGMVVLEDEAYPEVTVDFERDPDFTVTLGAGARWGDAGVSILGDIELWRGLMRNAKFAGAPNRLTVGTEVWEVMRVDADIRELLKLDFRPFNGGINLNLGLREGLQIENMGRLGPGLELVVYSDYYEVQGTQVPFMDPRDVVLTGPNIQGIRCFGAILDKKAGYQPLEIFPSMFESNDPTATFILTQSAPLMVPVNPNATFKARVLA